MRAREHGNSREGSLLRPDLHEQPPFHCWTATISSHLEFDGLIPGIDKRRYLDKHALKRAVKLARKGAGNHQPVSPPVARGAVAADVDRSRSGCAVCSSWLAYVDCITSVRLRQRNAIREAG